MRALLEYYADVMTAAARGAGCADCNHRGDCMNGTCFCEIRFTGEKCAGPNMAYHVCIGGIFLAVAFVCAMQLTVCIVTEYRRLKAPTFLRACKVTTQKMLYFVTFLASLIRGAYFVSPHSAFDEGWTRSLHAAYYPLVMTGSSLIVCFLAEVFHLRDIRWERPRFLSKSRLAFVTFNVISFSLLGAEVLTTYVADTSLENKTFFQLVFNLCYAVLLFIVVIFFLIYGVEVYFKLHGEFLKETKVCTITSPRPGPSSAADGDDVRDQLVTKQGIQTELLPGGTVDPRSVDLSQLHQSRLGLVSQALMLILIAGFLTSETLSEFWKAKVPVVSRNWHDVVFRLAEIGVALWFPCVLWNCMDPGRLWLLNPRRLLARQLEDARLADLVHSRTDAKRIMEFASLAWHEKLRVVLHVLRCWALSLSAVVVCVFLDARDSVAIRSGHNCKSGFETDSLVGSVGSARDCWICYDNTRPEPLITPCRCTGDVAAVHHDCLSRWLVESAASPDGLKCKVCNTPYIVQETNRVEWERGFTASHWVHTALAVLAMCGSAAGAWLVVQYLAGPVPKVLAAGAAMLVCYVAIRFLSMNTVTAYQRAKVSSLKILTDAELAPEHGVSTISRTVTVEIAPKAVLEQALKGEVK